MAQPGATWFREFGKCLCGKQATVDLMNNRNASMGPHCKRCAERRIKNDQAKKDYVRDDRH